MTPVNLSQGHKQKIRRLLDTEEANKNHPSRGIRLKEQLTFYWDKVIQDGSMDPDAPVSPEKSRQLPDSYKARIR